MYTPQSLIPVVTQTGKWLRYVQGWIPQYSYRGNLSDLPGGQKQHVKMY